MNCTDTPSTIGFRDSDYYPFGMLIPTRSFAQQQGDVAYRFGFNGMEKDDEVRGENSAYEFGGRSIYDPRLGRFFSIDPRTSEYAWQSSYAYYANSPISIIDYLGMGGAPIDDGSNDGGDRVDGDTPEEYFKYHCSETSSDDDGWLLHRKDLPVLEFSRLSRAISKEVSAYPGSKFLGYDRGRAYIGYDLGFIPSDVEPRSRWSMKIGTDETGAIIFGEQKGWVMSYVTVSDFEQVSAGESLIPVWGSGKSAFYNLKDGDLGWAAVNTGLAISDLFLVKSIYSGVSKVSIGMSGGSWTNMRKAYGKAGWAVPKQEVHHAIWKRHNQLTGTDLAWKIKSLPWNLKPIPALGTMTSKQVHILVEGRTIVSTGLHWRSWSNLGPLKRFYYGSPNWVIPTISSYGGRGIVNVFNPE
jgi:RHS repeat-associated protein